MFVERLAAFPLRLKALLWGVLTAGLNPRPFKSNASEIPISFGCELTARG